MPSPTGEPTPGGDRASRPSCGLGAPTLAGPAWVSFGYSFHSSLNKIPTHKSHEISMGRSSSGQWATVANLVCFRWGPSPLAPPGSLITASLDCGHL